MKFPGTKRARRWTKWVTNPAWQPRRSAGGSESLDDWMVESLQRWRDWKNPWKTFSTPWSSLVWMSRTGELVDYCGLWWTMVDWYEQRFFIVWASHQVGQQTCAPFDGERDNQWGHAASIDFTHFQRPLYPTSGWWIIPIMYPLLWLTYTACFWTHKCCSHFQVILLYLKFYWLCTHYMTTIHVT